MLCASPPSSTAKYDLASLNAREGPTVSKLEVEILPSFPKDQPPNPPVNLAKSGVCPGQTPQSRAPSCRINTTATVELSKPRVLATNHHSCSTHLDDISIRQLHLRRPDTYVRPSRDPFPNHVLYRAHCSSRPSKLGTRQCLMLEHARCV